jgi:hypothetical protein
VWQFDGATPFVYQSVIVAPFYDHLHVDGCLHHGFGIELVTPYKDDVKKNLYYATFHPEDNAVVLCMPRVSYVHRFCRESLALMAESNRSRRGSNYLYIPSFEVQKNTALNAIDKSKDRQLAKVLIQLPLTHQIVNSVLGKSDAEGETIKLGVDVCSVIKDNYSEEDESTHTDDTEGSWIATLRWFLTFKETEAREWQSIQPSSKTEGEAALEDAMSGVAHLRLGSCT